MTTVDCTVRRWMRGSAALCVTIEFNVAMQKGVGWEGRVEGVCTRDDRD